MSNDIPVYVIANLKITNEEVFSQYTNGFLPVIESFGGSVVTFDDATVTFEGQSPREGRMVILKFPSKQAAESWYGSDGYQGISESRRGGSTLEFLTMVHGLPEA